MPRTPPSSIRARATSRRCASRSAPARLAEHPGVGPAGSPCTSVTSVRFEPGGAPVRYCSPEDSVQLRVLQSAAAPARAGSTSRRSGIMTSPTTSRRSPSCISSTHATTRVLAPDLFAPVTPSPTNPLDDHVARSLCQQPRAARGDRRLLCGESRHLRSRRRRHRGGEPRRPAHRGPRHPPILLRAHLV